MLKKRTETKEFNNWSYERFEFSSPLLQQDFQCGLLRQKNKGPVHKVVYVLHGGNADDTQAVQAGLLPILAEVADHHPQENIQFIFPFIGSSFLHEHPTLPEKSFSNYFLQELIPACEGGLKIIPQNRSLLGWSMGGQAALSIFTRFPERFGGVGAHFPTLINFDYQDPQQQQAYAQRQKVSPEMLKVLVSEFQKEFLNPQDFANHNPLALVKAKDPSLWQQKKIYIDVGDEDEFGLGEGGKALHDLFKAKNIPHQFELVAQGKHDGAFLHMQIRKLLRYLL